MSIGYMVSPEQAMIWRGPMVQSALIQMLDDVAWPELDVLIIDMPPGTGDIQLTMAQRIPVTGALLVTTPSSLATADVKRAIVMFEKTEIPVFGLVENMAYMSAPDGTKLFPFGQGGHELADKLGLKHLAALPLEAAVQAASESGLPLSAAQNSAAETSETAQAFTNLAAALVRQI
jgi:ATP-binding protein involved in chromosome partitioning